MKKNIRQLTTAALFVAVGVALSTFYIPIGASKCFPIQHFINVLAGIILGPLPAVVCAFCTSVLRLFLSTGTLLAFPGSMIGALLSGLAFKHTRKIWAACAGEIFGTGVLGALCAFPVAALLMSREAALFAFVLPFSISSSVGALAGSILIYTLKKTKVLDKLVPGQSI